MAQPTWALGWGDAGWGSRLAQPKQPGWTAAEATQTFQERTPPTDAPDPTALAWYGLLVRPRPQAADQRGLRLVAGRPGSAVTMALLAWCSAPRAAHGCTAVCLLWENASGPRSSAVRHGLRPHQQQGKRGAVGVRCVVCPWPRTSPGRNPIEPQWVHGKRAVSEADRLLSADALAARVYADYGWEREAHLVMPKKVA